MFITKKIKIILIFCVITFFVITGTILLPQIRAGEYVNYDIVDSGLNSVAVSPNHLVFSREDSFVSYYSYLKNLPERSDVNPGINFNYNMAVVITTGEKHIEGYDINLDYIKYDGNAIKVYYEEIVPNNESKRRRLSYPYLIASVYYDKEIRENTRIISFFNSRTGEFIESAPFVKIKRSPFYEVPEKLRVVKVESGDYGNFTEETYLAFNCHLSFGGAYIKLRENPEYRVRPPELSFMGNIVVMMSWGDKYDGGYEISANGAYTNAYTLGDGLYIMVRKKEPTERTIRYYDETRPYSIASIQVGMNFRNVRKVYFIDELTGDLLSEVDLPRISY